MGSSSAAVDILRPQSFSVKGVLLPLTLLTIRDANIEKLVNELTNRIDAAPHFFVGGAVVLNFEGADQGVCEPDIPLMNDLLCLCRDLNLRVVAVKGDAQILVDFAEQERLAHFPAGKLNSEPRTPSEKPLETQSEYSQKFMGERNESLHSVFKAKAKTITEPVRSGQQIFSEGDLIVLAPVSAGAELLAVGNIHIYAPMRGRALAGIQGDETARIFCMSQQAELLSVAGHFMIDENLRQARWGMAAQVFFDGDELCVEPIA